MEYFRQKVNSLKKDFHTTLQLATFEHSTIIIPNEPSIFTLEFAWLVFYAP